MPVTSKLWDNFCYQVVRPHKNSSFYNLTPYSGGEMFDSVTQTNFYALVLVRGSRFR